MISDLTRRALDHRLARDQAAQRLPSVAAGLTRDGQLVWAGGAGLVGGAPPHAGTQYRAGSITKTFIAVAVMMLRDAGRLGLSDPIGQYVDAGAAGGLRIAELLSHSAGLRAETAGPWWERTPGAGISELTAGSLGAGAARFRPSRRHHYSNVGFGLLGALIESLRGRPWIDILSDDLFSPLGLNRTTARPAAPAAAGYAVHPHADALLPEPEHDAGAMAPAGQLWMTIADLAAWGRFLGGDTGGLLEPATLAEMREPIVVSDPAGERWTTGHGLGLQLWNVGGVRYFGHTGSMPGFTAILQVTDGPGRDTVVAACDSTAGFGRSLGLDLLGILADREPAFPSPWRPAEVSPEVLELLGTWYWGPVAFTLRLLGGSASGLLELRRDDDGQTQRFRPDWPATEPRWRGIDGYQAGEPLVPVAGPDGRPVALNAGSFIFTRTPYDPAAPVPGGVDPAGWRG